MSDAPKLPPKRMSLVPVSPDDFVRFITSKATKEDTCPICGCDQWSVLCSPDDLPVYRLGTAVRNREEQFYMSTFGYFCESCGYLRQHMAEVVYAWVKANPLPDQQAVDLAAGNELDTDD